MALARQGKVSVGVLVACCVLQACGDYDHTLIEAPVRMEPLPNTGTGGRNEMNGTGGTHGNDPDGSGGAQAQPRCGNGVLDDGEMCDISIAEDKPGACPTECEEAAKCAPRGVSGAGCQAQCVVLTPTCMGGDGCCSGNCTSDNDSDCSTSCGDGVVQASKGETCDPGKDDEDDAGTMSIMNGVPCKTQADCDDKDPCTIDVLTGSEKNCNADCSHLDQTNAINGDGCCPKNPDVNANNDNDCKPVCGNNVHEAGETCDGSDGCTEDCMAENTPDQMYCLQHFVRGDDACEKCMCLNCTSTVLDCRHSGNDSRDAKCSTVVECANDKDCVGGVCYCGSFYDPDDPLPCFLNQDGPCEKQVTDAAGSTDPTIIDMMAMDASSVLGRALAATNCGVEQCADVCP